MEEIEQTATKQETYDEFNAFGENGQQNNFITPQEDYQSTCTFTFGGNQLQDHAEEEVVMDDATDIAQNGAEY